MKRDDRLEDIEREYHRRSDVEACRQPRTTAYRMSAGVGWNPDDPGGLRSLKPEAISRSWNWVRSQQELQWRRDADKVEAREPAPTKTKPRLQGIDGKFPPAAVETRFLWQTC